MYKDLKYFLPYFHSRGNKVNALLFCSECPLLKLYNSLPWDRGSGFIGGGGGRGDKSRHKVIKHFFLRSIKSLGCFSDSCPFSELMFVNIK